jgi:uncharacterized secreted protein with C-terminal beta-propeller domain
MKKMTLSMLLLFLFTLFPSAPVSLVRATGPFTDVDTNQINYNAIQYLKTNNIIMGYGDNTFRPEQTINRAEFMKIVIGAVTSTPKGNNCFTDVQNQWFAPFICEAKTRGIVAGYADGSFRPATPITFSEASKVVVNALGVTKGANGDATTWFKPFILGLENKHAIPLSIDYFDKELTRGDMAEMVYRIKANVNTLTSRTYNEIMGEGFIKVNSCAELQDRFSSSSQRTYDSGIGIMTDIQPTSAKGVSETTVSNGVSSPDYSTTNIQVAGVDEADVVKNDGKYIYMIKGDSVRIIDAYPANNMKELVKIKLSTDTSEMFYPSEMYVDVNTLTVIGSLTPSYVGYVPSYRSYMPYYGSGKTKVYVLDITNRSNPVVKRSIEFDGNYQTSRKIGNTLYTVLNRYVGYIYPMYYDSATNTNVNSSPEDVMPKMKDSKTNTEQPIAKCSDVLILPRPQNLNYLITAAIPLADMSKDISSTVIVGNSENVYASQNNMYIADTDWSGSYFRAYQPENTAIYKFTLGDGAIAFSAAGSVKGRIINQFSMDENNGYFRIATTSGNSWDSTYPLANNLYVLDSNLKETGKIEGIATGEKIYSTRFVGNRAYMVTFKSIDPLFVIDMTDPNAPKMAGELKIPGYSTYLHPYDENHLIGFGNEVDESIDANKVHSSDAVYYTAVQGLKLGLFDVTDINHPTEMFKEVIGDRGTTSDLLTNHKALLFDKSKNLLAFPIIVTEFPKDTCNSNTYTTCPSTCQKVCVPTNCTLNNGIQVCTTDCDGQNSCISPTYVEPKTVFGGAYVYHIDLTNGFKLKGKITHFSADDIANTSAGNYGSMDYNKMIQRIIYIGENLYTISQAMIKANLMSDLTEKNTITLGGE